MAISREQQLLEKWRKLPKEKQQEVLNFVESKLEQERALVTPLGIRLRQKRANIVASGQPLLNREEIEREIIERRGGLLDIDE